MKKIYLLLFIALLNIPSLFSQAPSCQYDYNWLALGKDGIYPDSATNFVNGTVGVPYIQNITVKIPYDTTAVVFGSLQTVRFSRIDLQTNITNPVNYGLPPGLSIAGTPSNFKFPGNDTSCMVIYGTPTTPGTYNLSFTLKTYVVEFPLTSVSTDVIDYYKITINPAVGIKENQIQNFELTGMFPNPAINETAIKFQLPKSGTVKHMVFNALGKCVYSKTTESKKGENELVIDVKNLSSGIYFYTSVFDGKSKTKKLIVSND
jgi:hypothetical protein